MNFSKEYIKECDCPEIQGLHKKWIRNFDYYCWGKSFDITIFSSIYGERESMELYRRDGELIWLPTGDQLDEEIVKICVNKWWDYSFSFECDAEVDKYYAEIGEGNAILFANSNTNPLPVIFPSTPVSPHNHIL